MTTPFLAPELVDIAERLPSRLKADGHIAKPVLKLLAARYFPKEWIYRPNQGFPTPTLRWIDGPLGRWKRELLDDWTARSNVFGVGTCSDPDAASHYEAVWTAMTLEMFCRQFLDGEGGPPIGGMDPNLKAS